MLIIDMPMPKCCDDCDANYDACACGISGKAWYRNERYPNFDPSKERMPDCPIKGVLPEEHGDLIDRDELKKRCWHDDGFDLWVSHTEIDQQPIAIAAERKDDDK